MRKLKLQIQLSVDGFIAGPHGEMDWMIWEWDDQLKQYVDELTEPVDCIIMGRKLAPGFIPYWQDIASKPDDPQVNFAKKMTDTHKVVFTNTLDPSDPIAIGWKNTIIEKGALAEKINKLKNAPGKDIIVYGGASFVSALIQKGLIDELHLFVNPTAIGNGMTIFRSLDKKQDFKLVESAGFDCGIVVNKYELKK